MTLSRMYCSAVITLLLSTALSVAPDAMARPEMAAQNPAARLAAMDTDQDGKVSREEFFAAQPNMKETAFDAIDRNKDGFITLEEWEGFAMGHGKEDAPMGGSSAEVTPSENQKSPAPELIMPPKAAE